MLRALLAALLLCPAASAWAVTLDAPAQAAEGLPYLVEVCVDQGGELRLGQGRYAPVEAGCREVPFLGADVAARLRPRGGGPAKASAAAHVEPVDSPFAAVDAQGNLTLLSANGTVLLRAPPPFLPLLPGAAAWRDDAGEHPLPLPDRPVIDEALGPPFSGILLRNAGNGTLRLAGRTLGNPLPDATLSPGESVFLGATAPPGARLVPWKAPRLANATLMAAGRVEAAAPEVLSRPGLTAEDGTPFPIQGAIRLYATPDAGAAPVVDLIDGARREVLVEAYTITSPDVAAALARALARGVEVRALLEGAPVGGRPPGEEAILSALVLRGANVLLLESAPSFPTRFPTLHAKALVADRERALLSTDNLHAGSYPAVPGAGDTRGFGVEVDDATLAARLAAVMLSDMAPWPDVHPLAGDAPPADLAPGAGAAEGPSFRETGAWNASLVVSPDDGLTVLEMLRGARSRIDAEMLFADASAPFLDALVDAARRGVAVRLLLDGRVDDGRNAADVERLSALAAREGLPLEARVDASGRTLHAKAVAADDAIYVGSMNWGNASATRNREAGVILWNATGAAAWMRERMRQDWEWRPPQKATPFDAWLPLAAVALLTWARGRGPRRT